MIELVARRAEVKGRLIKSMIGKGIAQAMAETLAGISIDAIWREYGGQRVYFPKGRNTKADPDQVWEAFTGRNHQELASRFGVSVRRVEQIVAERTAGLQAAREEQK